MLGSTDCLNLKAVAAPAADSNQAVLNLYHKAYRRGILSRLWATLTRREEHNRLLSLTRVEAQSKAGSRHNLGLQTVPLAGIRGSEGRTSDFDARFNPLQERTRDRWLSVAKAYDQGIAFPPVELVRLGSTYFVRDGHHRLSVAAAMGQTHIEAVVTVWNAEDQDRDQDQV